MTTASAPTNEASKTLAVLADRARNLALQAKASSTKRAYQTDYGRFQSWATGQGLDFMPADPQVVALYITHMNELHKAPATIRRALAGISKAHQDRRLPSPTNDPMVSEIMKGIRRTRGTAQKQAKPLLAKHIKRLSGSIVRDVVGTRDRALLLIGWAGALRRSELCALQVDDIEYTIEGIVLTIRQSKTDQEAKGQKVAIPLLNNEHCPCRALDSWLQLAHIERGFVFCGIGPLGKGRFASKVDNSTPLNSRMVSLIVKKHAKKLGLNPALYSAHLLRAGWTTSAAAINAPDSVMMRHTRHRSLTALMVYIRDAQLFQDSPLPVLLAP